ncbi:MAG TPA: zinc-binding dehydrogenase [Anaerolineae bacterium]|nr:zinc-binding dehydrogenase [Anaerolineae bacterium]HNS52666.1 zinc-binding dehydrogenase [Anaerolineae bacterium]
MRAVRLVEIGKPLEMQEIPRPTVGEGEVLVRIKAAGICHSDVHYRAGTSGVGRLPQTLGHEVAGVIEAVGPGAAGSLQPQAVKPGDRVCLHYLLTCGQCGFCRTGREQFCTTGKMIGKDVDGGYAEYIAVPARNAVPLPGDVPFEQAAIMMCSSSTAFHALRKARLGAGDTVAVFGAGGLGMSVIQLARAMGAVQVVAVDINAGKLRQAEAYGALPVDARQADPVNEIRRVTGGRGVDVAIEVIGLPVTMEQAVRALAVQGRAALAGITDRAIAVDTYHDVIGREAEIIGVSDHLLGELSILVEFVRQGKLDLSTVVARTVPLDAAAINRVMDALGEFGGDVRTVIVP